MGIDDVIEYLHRKRKSQREFVSRSAWEGLSLIGEAGGTCKSSTFADLDVFCFFVGYPRSGHSLIGALLDAHPNIVIAHELHALDFVAHGITSNALHYLLLSRARWFAERNARWTGYKYSVPSQHKGEFDTIKVIGDKKGGATTNFLRQNPEMLNTLFRVIDVPIRAIHVTRHPLDNISTYTRKNMGGDLDAAIDEYFDKCETVRRVSEAFSEDQWLELALEDFITETRTELARLCEFLGADVIGRYVQDCTQVVFDKPKRSRHEVTWTSDQVTRIKRMTDTIPFLQRYSIESGKNQ